jgi:glycosyltransferase involved in cell wall biosynthesis
MSNQQIPTVSVIIPSYNYADLIPRCIQSVVDQTYPDWELIISDDHSSDNSLQKISTFRDNPKIQIYTNETTLGIYGNICAGISRSRGKYIKILMADDWLHPEYLIETTKLLEEYPSISLCSVNTELRNLTDGIIEIRSLPKPVEGFCPRAEALSWLTVSVNPYGNPSRILFRRDAYVRCLGFDLEIEYCTELDLWIRMLEDGDFGYIGKVLTYELQHNRNATLFYASNGKHITEGEKMFVKLFARHTYFRGKVWRQQMVWLYGWLDYWNHALYDFLHNQPKELSVLIGVLRRRSYLVIWLPCLVFRFGAMVIHKSWGYLKRKIELGLFILNRHNNPID